MMFHDKEKKIIFRMKLKIETNRDINMENILSY